MPTWEPAHPRSRGENLVGLAVVVGRCGSSPLTRGKRVGVTLDVWRRGLIPAHAGKTCVCMSTGLGWSAHPRSRGENVFDGARNTHPCGSSPLTRGKPYYLVQHMQHGRLIPAHAGKTMFRRASSVGTSAHPRSRGENKAVSTLARKHVGSSPLTRGKRPGPTRGEALTGLIPAHAGKTVSTVASIGWQTAHPRSRGENLPHGRKGGAMTGSSPLTRGKHFLTCVFTAQIDQILETLELAASFGSYLIWVACATDAPQDPVRSIGLVLPSSRGAS